MPAKIFCLASSKGGSGKTIVTATLSAFLAGLGKKVLILDADGATNGLTLFYLREVMAQQALAISNNRTPFGVYEAHMELDLNLKMFPPEIVKLSNGVHFIPATFKFKDTGPSSCKSEFTSSLKYVLESTKHSYDYIFIDTQAGSNDCAKICMDKKTSDEVIIVSEWDPISNAGIERISAILKDDLTPNRTWVLYNKLLPDFAKSYDEFLKYSKYLPPIPWDADVVKAYVNLELALDLENGNDHTLAIIHIVKSLLGTDISSEIDEWMKQRAAVIRQPINKQYDDLEMQLKENIHSIDELYRKKGRNTIITALQFALATVFLIIIGLVVFSLLFVSFSSIFQSQLFGFGMELLIIIIFVATIYIVSNKFKESPEFQVSKSRLLRQQSVLEERLKKMEILKTADLETLVKYKKLE